MPKKFNEKDFDIRKVIKKRVDLEAEIEHSNDPVIPLPKYIYIKPKKNTVWWWNFSKNLIREFNP